MSTQSLSVHKKISVISTLIFVMAQTAFTQNIITLEQARQNALRENKKISIQNDSIKIAQLGIDRAKTKALPKIDGTATGIYFGNPIGKYFSRTTAALGGTASELIYAGGKVKNGVKLAQVNSDVQQLLLVKNKADIILNTDSAYWQIVYLKQQIASLNQSQQYVSSALKDVNNGFKAGTKYKNDVLQMQIQYNQNELSLLKLRDALELSKLNLLQITGLDMSQDFDVADTVTFAPIQLSIDSSYDSSVNNRAEVKVLQKSVEAGELQTKIAKADMLPQISAVVFGFASISSDPGLTNLLSTNENPVKIDNTFESYLGLVSVSIPIFNWGDYKKKAQQQQIRNEANKDQLTDTKQKLVLDIRQNWYALKEAEVNIAVTKLSLEQADENLRLATNRLKAGTILTTDWLIAQVTWQQSYTQAIKAKVEYKINVTKFQKAIGALE